MASTPPSNHIPGTPQIDLAPLVGASLEVMDRDAARIRDGGPVIFSAVKHDTGVNEIIERILGAWRASGSSIAGHKGAAVTSV